MHFNYKEINSWPPLAWLVECETQEESVTVYHGENVECYDDWFCEGIWEGSFAWGDFDKTDIVAGSGGRIRKDGLWFISSGSNVDRLNSIHLNEKIVVSNSLCCLLAWTNSSPLISYTDYEIDFANYCHTILGSHNIDFPSSNGTIKLTYFANLFWDGMHLHEHEKPYADRRFHNFDEYRIFLNETMQGVMANAMAPERKRKYKMLCPISTGYDSPTVAAIASSFSNIETFTFEKDGFGINDSGVNIAKALNIPCQVIDRDAWHHHKLAEVPFISGSGSFGDCAFKSAEFLLKRSILFTAPGGDKVWGKFTPKSQQLEIGDGTMLGLSEYRLIADFINCPVPLWGARQVNDIIDISNTEEMKPWDAGDGKYTRPICRRIVEESGVPRTFFGMQKKGVSVVTNNTRDFLRPESKTAYYEWMKAKKKEEPALPLPSVKYAAALDNVFTNLAELFSTLHDNLNYKDVRRLRKHIKKIIDKLTDDRPRHKYAIHWAIECAKEHYKIHR